MKYSVSIDVPQLDQGLRFYRDALGLAEVARPIATYALLRCGESHIGLMEKPAGSRPAMGSEDVRRYDRHWTPVHIDFHAGDFEAFLSKAMAGGAKCEQKFEGGGGGRRLPSAATPSATGFASWEISRGADCRETG